MQIKYFVPRAGVEPASQRDTILSRACIPIPPPRHILISNMRRRPESNRCMVVLQTTALPLRHYAFIHHTSYKNNLYYNIKFQKTPVFKITLSGDFLIYFFNLYFVVRLSMPYFF